MQEISFRDNILPLKDKLFRLALRITFDRAEAEDIVQDALIKVWNKRDEWGELESIEAYCLTVVRNLAIDRSQKKEAQNLTLTPETQEMPDTQTPESQFERNEQFQLVHRLVNELPEKQRTIVQLRDIEGKSYKEIADVLGITEEQILRIFFQQKELPAHLRRYRSLFTYQEEAVGMKLGDDFDKRVLAEIERPVVKARKLTLYSRFMPLFKAAAMMLLLFTLGGVVKHATEEGGASGIVYVHDQFENRQETPQVAYEGDSVKTLIRETSSKPRLEENSNR